MFASSPESLARRRGIVLVVVLGMLGLMALIGVTFATFAGQSLISSRNFGQGVARPQAEALMDFALAQLINDTNNPVSAIRGHSLLRDMYGNDSVFRGSNPTANPASETGGMLTQVYSQANGVYVPPQIVGFAPRLQSKSSPSPTPFYNQIQFQTNIPTSGQYYGLDFTRWILKLQGSPARGGNNGLNNIDGPPINGFASQSFEVLEDDASGSVHLLTLSNNLINPLPDPRANGSPSNVPSDWAAFLYVDPNYMNPNVGVQQAGNATPTTYAFTRAWASLAEEWNGNLSFVLDGRNMRAFNGPGLTQVTASPYQPNVGGVITPSINVYPFNVAAFANFRLNGFNPDGQGMDEDYDACDLENWFLALQSADGQVVIPSFHRPGILMAADWTAGASVAQVSKILRPRQIDNSPLFPPDPSTPDAVTGKITYDIDNDGDGVTDSVWVDLGYSVQRDPGGKLYKPLFAFMVLGLNGRLPLNTVGNLQARANADTTNNPNANATSPPYTSGQVPQPGIIPDNNTPPLYYKYAVVPQGTGQSSYYNPFFATGGTTYSSQTYNDAPLWDHTSHLGYSVNEINPKFALQNAPSNAYGSPTGLVAVGIPGGGPVGINYAGLNYSQTDDAGVPVALTQLRNILAGTIPSDKPNPYTGTYGYPFNPKFTPAGNDDVNLVVVNGQYMVLPNNVADPYDVNRGNSVIYRGKPAVPGRWGEAAGIQAYSSMPFPGTYPFNPTNMPALNSGNPTIVFPGLIYNNPVRAGRSYYINGTNDVMDDDFDGTDPVLTQYNAATLYYFTPTRSVTSPQTNTANVLPRILPEQVDTFDSIGQRAVASERIRQFVSPIDPAGTGRIVNFANRPNNDYDYGTGYDNRGRTSYFRYFRPAGMPQEIRYPYRGVGSTYNYPYSTILTSYPTTYPIVSTYFGHAFLMPQLFPAGQIYPVTQSSNPGALTGASDIHNNRYHGYQSMLTPEFTLNGRPTVQDIASMAAMPYDWDSSLNNGAGDVPGGYPYANSVASPLTPPPTSPPIGTSYVNNFTPTINPNVPNAFGQSYVTNPVLTSINTSHGPNFGLLGNPGTTALAKPLPVAFGNYPDSMTAQPYGSPVVNSYLFGGLNKDEADEMNLYAPNRYDMPYGPSDLEWLYRLQDVDGATLSSRLSQLAPVSFLNPADGLTRRRLFSTDSWEPTGWVYANDNPAPYAGMAYVINNGAPLISAGTDHSFAYNSRFTTTASPSLEIMNQVDGYIANPSAPFDMANPQFLGNMANPITTIYLPNPTFPTISDSKPTSYSELVPNSNYGNAISMPAVINIKSNVPNFFDQAPSILPAVSVTYGLAVPHGNNSMVQVQTPSLAHRDRRINLNYPLPISNDPAEPVRQKWCRETYTLLKAILPPASVDTPEELAALSQFVVNIIDFRDPDPTMTRFVNTDLIVTDVLTKTASAVQPTATGTTLLSTWNVSPPGVRFATSGDAGNLITTPPGFTAPVRHYPYDPDLYSPDATTPFLVQHGMEYNPIAINEVLGLSFPYGAGIAGNTTTSLNPTNVQGLFIELVNTLTEEQNNNGSTANSSAINLAGWDIIMTPDNYGWGRPDPISGDVSSIAYPPLVLPAGGGTVAMLPPPNMAAPMLNQVRRYAFPTGGTAIVKGINAGTPDYFVLGTTLPTGALQSGATPSPYTLPTDLNMGTILTNPPFTAPATGKGKYFWVYLRRPANPFDTAALDPNSANTTYRPNREMVVVDSMRFAFIDAGTGTASGNPSTGTDTVTMKAPNNIYSARRLQPYRGGHLVPVNTTAGTPAGADSSADGVTTICPPSPPHAYGYSEQMHPIATSTVTGSYKSPMKPSYFATTQPILESLNAQGTPSDTNWAHLPFHDRDFTSVAELLLVPGCPPGLFTKQFVEEPYPGNTSSPIVSVYETYPTTPLNGNATAPVTYGSNVTYTDSAAAYAKGFDDTSLNMSPPVTAPMSPTATSTPQVLKTATTTTSATSATYGANAPGGAGRTDFGKLTSATFTQLAANSTPVIQAVPSTPVAATFPYLPDNFYYSAASVSPPLTGGSNYPDYYQKLTTEIGGWTGAGWHKMLEFFEVPSSANGAVGTADGGTNFDWARADIKPGLLNLNLIIDEEVFAGLFDDPRLNERLAAYGAPGSSFIPSVVTQIDANGYPTPTGSYPMSSLVSTNFLNSVLDTSGSVPAGTNNTYVNGNNTPTQVTLPNANLPRYFGRGYTVRDPDSQDYGQIGALGPGASFPYQQVHGMKAAFSDFLKLRHGGSGFLFAHGAGPVGSGDLGLVISQTTPSQPVASDRPYRSLSYPDINYTIMRPASLPPSSVDPRQVKQWAASTPSFSTALNGQLNGASIFAYQTHTPANYNMGNNVFIELTPVLAPRNQTTPFQYVNDPGLKNPFLPVQYAFTSSPDTGPGNDPVTNMPISNVPPSISFANPTYGVSPYGGPPYPVIPFGAGGNIQVGTRTQFVLPAAPFPPPIPPTPAARLLQVPDIDTSAATFPSGMVNQDNTGTLLAASPTNFTSNAATPGQSTAVPIFPSSNASVLGQHDGTTVNNVGNGFPIQPSGFNTDGYGQVLTGVNNYLNPYAVNWPTVTAQLYSGGTTPPTLVPQSRPVFLQDNNTPLAGTTYAPQTTPPTNLNQGQNTAPNAFVQAGANNYLGAGSPLNIYGTSSNAIPQGASFTDGGPTTTIYANGLSPALTINPVTGMAQVAQDYRQHPLYRIELLQKIMNLTTVRTHQFAVWITVGFFEVVKPGTPELGLPDVLGQELALAAGHNIRYRSFFVVDRTKATGFNPYYPGNFRDCVTYRRRIE